MLPIDLNKPLKPAPKWGEIIADGVLVVALFALMLFILLGW